MAISAMISVASPFAPAIVPRNAARRMPGRRFCAARTGLGAGSAGRGAVGAGASGTGAVRAVSAMVGPEELVAPALDAGSSIFGFVINGTFMSVSLNERRQHSEDHDVEAEPRDRRVTEHLVETND